MDAQMTDHIKFALDCIGCWQGTPGTGEWSSELELAFFREDKINVPTACTRPDHLRFPGRVHLCHVGP